MSYIDPAGVKTYGQMHYAANKAAYKARAKARSIKHRKMLRDWVWAYLLAHPCVDCGESDPLVLQFDHQRDKVTEVCNMIRRCFPLRRVEAEITKCEVRCANCHQRKTARERGWWSEQRSNDGEP